MSEKKYNIGQDRYFCGMDFEYIDVQEFPAYIDVATNLQIDLAGEFRATRVDHSKRAAEFSRLSDKVTTRYANVAIKYFGRIPSPEEYSECLFTPNIIDIYLQEIELMDKFAGEKERTLFGSFVCIYGGSVVE